MKRAKLAAILSLSLCILMLLLPAAASAAPGQFLFQIGPPHVLAFPVGVAVDGAGNTYVSDYSLQGIAVFDKNGNRLRFWGSFGSGNGEFSYPDSLAVTGNLVYVIDLGNDRIQEFDSNGNFIRSWGTLGSGIGEFDSPRGIALDNKGNVYVADTSNNRMQVFDGSGNFIRAFGTFGTGDGEFASPSDVAVDKNGNIFVIDNYTRVQVFSSTGTFLRKWELSSVENFGVSKIAIDSDGNVVLAEASFTEIPFFRVQLFDAFGNLIRTVLTLDSGRGPGKIIDLGDMAVDASNNIYLTDGVNDRVQIFDSSGNLLRIIGGLDGNGQFDNPQDVATDTFGNVYVCDSENYRVQVFDSEGNFLRKFGSQGSREDQFTFPVSIAVDRGGNILVGDIGQQIFGHAEPRIMIFDNSGKFLRSFVWPTPQNDHYPEGLAVDSNGNVYALMQDRIDVFDSSGTLIRSWGSFGSGNGQFDSPSGIALDSFGNGYVTDTFNYRIQVFSANGTFLRSWGSRGTGDGQFSMPRGIAVDGARNVYVADIDAEFGFGRMQVFDSTGKFLGKWGSYGTGPGKFVTGAGVAANSSGSRVYVADGGNNNYVQAFVGFGDDVPTGWVGRDIGSVGVKGHASYSNGTFTLQGSGANIWGTVDAFHYVYKPLVGDGEIVARVTAVQNTNGYAKGGVMIRSSLDANSAHAMVDITPGYGAEFSRRLTAGASTSVNATAGITAPYWVKLARLGNTFTASISKDGGTWTTLGSASISMGNSVYAGLIANSHNNSVLCTTTMDRVSLNGVSNTPSVAIVAPQEGATFTAPALITVTVATRPSSGATTKQVEFYADSTLIGTTNLGGSNSVTWNNVPAGSYVLTAKMTDSFGGTATSEPVNITVVGAGLPTPWLTQDVGSVGVAGSATYLNGVFTVKGSGANIYGTADAFRFVYQPMSGNGQIVARVTSIQNTNTYAKAGVMIRQSLTANSTHAMVDITPTSGAEFSRRTSTGGSTTPTAKSGIAAPYWVKLVRSGSTFTGSISSDGVNWVQIGSTTISMTGTVYVGLIVNSHNNSVLCTATLDCVAVSTTIDNPPVVTAFSVPSTSSSLTVPITTFTATDDFGVTGYLLTESATTPSPTASGWSASPPASYTFATTGTKTLYAWAKDAAGNVSSSRSATVTISVGGLPSPWLTQDIGSAGVIGSASYLNGTFTLKGSGADIWGSADAFRFVYKVMTGDGQIIARVASLQNTNPYAKGGVMMRQSLTANSMHAMMDLRPTGGAEFSRRTSTGGTTTATTRTGIAAPYWVRLVRSGNTFTGSVSSDGVTWSQVGSATISMTSSIYVGLIVNSHYNTVLCTTTIDHVQ